MPVNRIALIGLSVLGLTATITIALAQNTSNPMLSGNTTNPILSGNTVSQPPPVPVSPALPTTLLGPPIGRNQFTGLPRNLGDSEWKFDNAAITNVPKCLRLIAVVLKPPGVGLNFCPAVRHESND
jgi:hypothetical protein